MQALPSTAGDGRTVPGFIGKLWQMVNDDEYDALICWDVSGKSFHIIDEGVLSKQVLPLFYKHNNISSFIRQLNFYGFQKKPNLGALRPETTDSEFWHPCFQRDRPNLLPQIKRKTKLDMGARPLNTNVVVRSVTSGEVDKVLGDVQQVQNRVDNMDHRLESMKKENAVLWRELSNLRQKHSQQQQVVHKLVQFLLSMVGRGSSRKKRNLAIEAVTDQSPTKRVRVSKSSGSSLPDNSYIIQSPDGVVLEEVPSTGVVIQDITSPPKAEVSQVNPAGDAVSSSSLEERQVHPRKSRPIKRQVTSTDTSGSAAPILGTSGLRVATPAEEEEINQQLLAIPDEKPFRTEELDQYAQDVDASLTSLKESLGNSLSLDVGMIADLFDPQSPLPNPNEFNWVVDPSKTVTLPVTVPSVATDPLDNGTIKGNELIPSEDIQDFDIMEFLNNQPVKSEPKRSESVLQTPSIEKKSLDFDLD